MTCGISPKASETKQSHTRSQQDHYPFLDIFNELTVCLGAAEKTDRRGSTEGKALHEGVSAEQFSLFN